MSTMLRRLAICVAAITLASCDSRQSEQVPDLPIRAIKYMTIGETVSEDQRTFAGIVEAGANSKVAFEIGGRVLELTVRVGDVVAANQLLARLDPHPYELQVTQAQNSVEQAIATEADARAKYTQQKILLEKQFTTRTAFDSALANLKNAEGQVGIAQSQLALKNRESERTQLIAPFGGRVAERFIEAYEEVTPGQPIFSLQTEGEDRVAVSIPEQLIPRISIGQPVTVSFPAIERATTTGSFTEISPVAGAGNAYPVKIRLDSEPENLRAGMTAEIKVNLEMQQTGDAFSVPIGALKGSADGPSQALIYVFDEDNGVVRERPVKVVGVNGNRPQIIGDIRAGEIIATAGVGYMFDGMQVRLLDPNKPI